MRNFTEPKLPNKFVAEFEGFRALTLKERIKILFGFNIRTTSKVLVDRRNTSVKGKTDITLTKALNAEGEIRNPEA